MPTKENGGLNVKQAAMLVEHPFRLQFDSESIRGFLCKYGTYCREVSVRASQLVGDASSSLDPVYSVSLLYCVDVQQLTPASECGMIEGCIDVDELKSTDLCEYPDKKAK